MEQGRQQSPCKGVTAAVLLDSALSQAPSSNALVCTSCSLYFVCGFEGRMCLNLHLSNLKLLAHSDDVVDAAVEDEIGAGIHGGLPTLILLHSFCYSQGWLGCSCDSRNTQPSVSLINFL